jgi:hypothetical protein
MPDTAPEIEQRHRALAMRMRRKAEKGWYTGDMRSLQLNSARAVVFAVTEPELAVSLSLSRDKMHHSVGWWRNADYEYCWHLSMATKAIVEGGVPDQGKWSDLPFEHFPPAEVRYWIHAFFREDVDKLWMEPGGTDPRLTMDERRAHATMWHARLFLNPLILNRDAEPFVPFMPEGEVYDLTKWIDGLTPPKVDR